MDRPGIYGEKLSRKKDAPIRLGLLGAGRWGQVYIRTIRELVAVQLACVASRNPRTKDIVPAGCYICSDWREVVQAAEVDGIVVATPPSTHAEIVLACTEARTPVLVEKPLTITPVSAEAVLAAAVRTGTLVMVDHTHLFHPAYRALKQIALERGPIRGITSSAGNRGPYRPEVSVLWDWGPHDVAMCLDLLQAKPYEVRAQRLDARRINGALAERLQIDLVFPGGIRADIRLSTLDDRQRRFAVLLDSETLVYDPLAAGATLTRLPAPDRDGPSGQAKHVPVSGRPPLTCAVLEFAAAVAERSTSLESVKLGLQVVHTLARCENELQSTRA